MAKIITVTDLAAQLTGKVQFDKDFALEQAPIQQVYEDNLPNDITMDTVNTIRDYDKNFFAVYAEEVGKGVVDVARENDAVETLEAVTNLAGLEMGVFYSKPMVDEPKQEDYEASLGFGMSLPKPLSIEKEIRGKLGAMFLAEEDDE